MPDVTDDERMRAAVELAGASPSPAAQGFLRDHKVSSRGRVVPIFAAVMIVGAAFGYLLAVHHGPTVRTPVPGWRLAVGWGLWVCGMVVIVVSFVRRQRSGVHSRLRQQSRPMQVLTGPQRKGLLRQVRGQDAVVPEQLPLLRNVATTMVGTEAALWALGAVIALLVGNALRTNDRWLWWVAGAIVLLVIGSAPAGVRQHRRASRFLAAHPTAAHPTQTTELTP